MTQNSHVRCAIRDDFSAVVVGMAASPWLLGGLVSPGPTYGHAGKSTWVRKAGHMTSSWDKDNSETFPKPCHSSNSSGDLHYTRTNTYNTNREE